MREMVRSYFADSLDRYMERLNDTGLSERSLDTLRQELDVHEDAIGGFDDLSDLYLDADPWTAFALQRASQTLNGPKMPRPCAKRCAKPAGTKSRNF